MFHDRDPDPVRQDTVQDEVRKPMQPDTPFDWVAQIKGVSPGVFQNVLEAGCQIMVKAVCEGFSSLLMIIGKDRVDI
nr:hypothetical protein [Prosthecobacter fusiformis]